MAAILSRGRCVHQVTAPSKALGITWRLPCDLTQNMLTSSNGNIFRVTGFMCGEFIDLRWIPRTKASDAEPWCFLWSAPWINGWVNNREACDLRRQSAHYEVIVMKSVLYRPRYRISSLDSEEFWQILTHLYRFHHVALYQNVEMCSWYMWYDFGQVNVKPYHNT